MTLREYKTSLQYNANTKQDYCIVFYSGKKVVLGSDKSTQFIFLESKYKCIPQNDNRKKTM